MGIRIWGSDKRSLFSSEEEQGGHVTAATTGALQAVTGDGSSASRQPDQGGPAVSVKEATAWGSSPPGTGATGGLLVAFLPGANSPRPVPPGAHLATVYSPCPRSRLQPRPMTQMFNFTSQRRTDMPAWLQGL